MDDSSIENLQDDLMTVLESYMNEMTLDDLFYHAIKFITTTLYECADNEKEGLKSTRKAIADGLREYADKRRIKPC